MNIQTEMDLGDKLQKFEHIAKTMVETHKYTSGCSVRIFSTEHPDTFWLGTRTFNYETEYTHNHKIDWETAKYLLTHVPEIVDHLGEIKKRLLKDQYIVCPKCGHKEMDASDLIRHHKENCKGKF